MPATFVVTTAADVVDARDGVVSLRQAIIEANKSPKTADTVVLPAGNYVLTRAGAGEDNGLTGDLDIKGPLTITAQAPVRPSSMPPAWTACFTCPATPWHCPA